MDSLSVIVTAYNFGPFVGRSLQSVHDALAVFHAEFGRDASAEIVVVDDGSTDDTPRVVQSFLAGRPDWRVLRRPEPSSPGAARNAGVGQSHGDLLFFLDGDDLFLPPHLAACWRAMREGAGLCQDGRASGRPGPRRLARPYRIQPRHQPGRAAVLPRLHRRLPRLPPFPP